MLDTALLSDVQRLVVEPVDGGLTFPSGLWTAAEVLGYLTQRQNQFLKESLSIIGTNILPVLANQSVVNLPEDWMATAHVAWQAADGTWHPVYPGDSTQADYGSPGWAATITTVPLTWTDAETPTASLRLMPPPSQPGTLVILYAAIADPPTGGGTLLTVPDDFCVFVRYGVLADMFNKQGRAYDPARAQACEARFREGVDLVVGILKGWD